MTTPIDIVSKYLPVFLFVLLRSSVFLLMLPLFSSANVPAQLKIGFAVAMAFILTPIIEINVTVTQIPILVVREILFGIVLGLAARFVFLVVEMAGQLMSNVMGLSIAAFFNPEFGQSTELSRLYGILSMLVFLSVDAHHDLIYIFVRSYEWLPIGQSAVKDLFAEAVSLGSRMFQVSLKLSMPVITIMLINNLVMGFLNKAAPQMNVFFVGYPVYLFVGFLVMLFGMPVFMQVIGGYFGTLKDEMLRVIVGARG